MVWGRPSYSFIGVCYLLMLILPHENDFVAAAFLLEHADEVGEGLKIKQNR